jgi:hypothetical protein
LGGKTDVLFGRLPDAVVIDGVEPVGGSDFLGLDGGGGEPDNEFEGNCLAGLWGAGGLLSVFRGHVPISQLAGLQAHACIFLLGCGSLRPGTKRLRHMLLDAAELRARTFRGVRGERLRRATNSVCRRRRPA